MAVVSAEPLHIALKNGQTIVGLVTTKNEKFEVASPNGPLETPKAEVVAVRNTAEQHVYMRMEQPRIIDLWAVCWAPASVSPEEIRSPPVLRSPEKPRA